MSAAKTSPRPPARPKLAEALVAAVKALEGSSVRDTATEGRRMHVGHPEVMAHTRAALLGQGLTLVPVSLRLMEAMHVDGGRLAWRWEASYELVHVSGERLPVGTDVVTPPHEWGAAPASTLADRLVLMRLMRLAGDESAEREQQGERGERGESRSERTAPSDRELNAGKLVSQLTRDLGVLKPVTSETLALFWADAQKQLRDHQANASHHLVVTRTFREVCGRAGLDPDKVVALQGARS